MSNIILLKLLLRKMKIRRVFGIIITMASRNDQPYDEMEHFLKVDALRQILMYRLSMYRMHKYALRVVEKVLH